MGISTQLPPRGAHQNTRRPGTSADHPASAEILVNNLRPLHNELSSGPPPSMLQSLASTLTSLGREVAGSQKHQNFTNTGHNGGDGGDGAMAGTMGGNGGSYATSGDAPEPAPYFPPRLSVYWLDIQMLGTWRNEMSSEVPLEEYFPYALAVLNQCNRTQTTGHST